MPRMIAIPYRKIKPTRRTARPAAPFGDGLLPRPSRRFEPSAEDRAWAAAAFADGPVIDHDTLAGEAAALASMEALSPPAAGICLSCGEMAETPSYGYCPACDDAGTEATTKGENHRAGLGYRVL